MDGLLLATVLSGIILAAVGLLRLGTYITFIPYSVTVGFTAGIAAIIFASQVKELLGLTLDGPDPGPLLQKLPILWHSLPSLDPAAGMLALAAIIIIAGLKRVRPHWPGMLIAVAAVPFLDSTAANTIEALAGKAARRGVRVMLTGTSREVRKELFAHGIRPRLVSYEHSIERALSKARAAQMQEPARVNG
jgi:SulP family sulfate permease